MFFFFFLDNKVSAKPNPWFSVIFKIIILDTGLWTKCRNILLSIRFFTLVFLVSMNKYIYISELLYLYVCLSLSLIICQFYRFISVYVTLVIRRERLYTNLKIFAHWGVAHVVLWLITYNPISLLALCQHQALGSDVVSKSVLPVIVLFVFAPVCMGLINLSSALFFVFTTTSSHVMKKVEWVLRQ